MCVKLNDITFVQRKFASRVHFHLPRPLICQHQGKNQNKGARGQRRILCQAVHSEQLNKSGDKNISKYIYRRQEKTDLLSAD